MAIVQCEFGHYYDDRGNANGCPYCRNLGRQPAAQPNFVDQPTAQMGDDTTDGAAITELYDEDVTGYEKTVGVFTDESHSLFTVAWLVCTAGAEKGKSYVIHAGRNFAGRSPHMDLVLAGDDGIAREGHFSIVYDPKSIAYCVMGGAGHTYLNGQPVREREALHEGDVLQVGASEYAFVPFCREGRVWE